VKEGARITTICALMHYGLHCYDGRECIEALEEIGATEAAEVLRHALSRRIYNAPGVRDWAAEEERDRQEATQERSYIYRAIE